MTTPPRTATRARGRKAPALRPSVTSVDYKDVDLLGRFISDRGKVRSGRTTGITPRQQRMVTRAIKNAREMALLGHVDPRR